MLCMLENQTRGSYEFKEVDQKRPELGMVSCESKQNGKNIFAERGGECVEWPVLQRIWECKEKIFDKKRTKQTDQMMRGILMHANIHECKTS